MAHELASGVYFGRHGMTKADALQSKHLGLTGEKLMEQPVDSKFRGPDERDDIETQSSQQDTLDAEPQQVGQQAAAILVKAGA